METHDLSRSSLSDHRFVIAELLDEPDEQAIADARYLLELPMPDSSTQNTRQTGEEPPSETGTG